MLRNAKKGGLGRGSPSPTRKWSSGFERILLVSIMGGIWPAPTAALYAAWVGYRGGGGRTLRAVISETSVILWCFANASAGTMGKEE
jgi:hypothetical protein